MEDETRVIDIRQMTQETLVYMNDAAIDEGLDEDKHDKAVDNYCKVGKLNLEEKRIDIEDFNENRKILMQAEKQTKELGIAEAESVKKIELMNAQIKTERSKRFIDAAKLALVGVCYIGFNGIKMYLERKEQVYISDRDFDVSEKKLSGLQNLFGKK